MFGSWVYASRNTLLSVLLVKSTPICPFGCKYSLKRAGVSDEIRIFANGIEQNLPTRTDKYAIGIRQNMPTANKNQTTKTQSTMTLDEYQKGARTTAIYPKESRIVYPTLGLTGEAGEVADKVKKVIRDNGGQFSDERKREIALELGDVMWYVASLAHDLGYSLEEVAQMNLDKLASRMQRDKIHGSGDER
jgi:NTP pyrophosphatase (non-canonical NTP hydrolase)